jgi:hypothetical protein
MGDDAKVADVGHINRERWFQVHSEFDANFLFYIFSFKASTARFPQPGQAPREGSGR